MRKTEKRTGRQAFLRFLFLVYAAAMIWLLFGQRWGNGGKPAVNLTPFATVKLYLWILRNSRDIALLTHGFVNLAGNVVMFVPLGFFVPYLCKRLRKFIPAALAVLCLILAVELVQYVTCLGSCDVDDVILNLAGAVIGYVYWKIRSR